jgi:hypothetical protein
MKLESGIISFSKYNFYEFFVLYKISRTKKTQTFEVTFPEEVGTQSQNIEFRFVLV